VLPTPRPTRGPRATRRTALGVVVAGALATSGCDLGGSGEASAPAPSATAAGDPDAALVDDVVTEVDELLALVTAAADRRPALAPALAPLAALHRAHRDALPAREPAATAPDVGGPARAVAEQVLRREAQARERLADWAVAARSGGLARLLASMSAGVAAHLADSDLGAASR
jgi:hypothetical protein